MLQAGAGQPPARQAARARGIPLDVPAVTMNKVCLSSLDAIALADQLIRAGDVGIVVAGGMESMSRAPHLLPGSRTGASYGDVTMIDHLAHDGLHDVFTEVPMGQLTETTNDLNPVTRFVQDTFAALSQRRAATALAAGVFKAEIEPVVVRGSRGDVVVDTDEGIRPDTTVETLGQSRPAFRTDGTMTAGTSSQLSDGAAVVVMSRDEAERRGLGWIAEITADGMIAEPGFLRCRTGRRERSGAACVTARIAPADLDLVEINEAFAAVRHRVPPATSGSARHIVKRQRRRDRHGPPRRDVRCPDHHASGTGTAAPRRRDRGCRPVRRAAGGRRAVADRAQAALTPPVSTDVRRAVGNGRAGLRAMAGQRDPSEVVAGVGEVETLVGQREVGDDRVRQGDGQGGPVEERRVDDPDPGQQPGGVQFDPVHDGAAPALDDPDPGGGMDRRGLRRRGIGWAMPGRSPASGW